MRNIGEKISMNQVDEFMDNDKSNGKGLVQLVGDELRKIADKTGMELDYFGICAYALEFLEEIEGEGYDFPIDIEAIVKKMGIDIVYQSLNYKREIQNMRVHKIVGKVIKRKNRFTGEDANMILIDDESKKDEQRYALAHGLAHFLLHVEDKWYSGEYRVMPMLFKKKEEMIADIFAIFLLIPLPVFLREFDLYVGEESVPVKTSEWLKYLSNVAEVPYEDVAIGYQNLRYVFSYIYNLMEEKESFGDRDPKIQAIFNKQIEKVISILKKEGIVKKLFC